MFFVTMMNSLFANYFWSRGFGLVLHTFLIGYRETGLHWFEW